jgi:SAM-dependent methyltransferase
MYLESDLNRPPAAMRSACQQHLHLHLNMLQELGHTLPAQSRVLDFGCGSGEMVSAYRAAGHDAFGCDIVIDQETPELRRIRSDDLRIPFDDDTFDFVFSDQVFEHVTDPARAACEIWRVLKPGGVSLHIFPSKLKPIESHVFVPLAGAIQSYTWLLLWSFLGVRNQFQQGMKSTEVARLNYEFLKTDTHYLNRAEILRAFSSCIGSVKFAEAAMIKHTYGKARYLYPLLKFAPPVARLYSAFYCRVVFAQKQAT